MQTLTFTQKILRQRRFLSFLLPLFALFVGLGSSQSVLAQAASTVVSNNATFSTTQAGTSASGIYDTQSATAPPVAPATFVFNGNNFGTFNLATDAFTLSNASFTINQAAGENYDQAQLRYRVFPGTLSTASTNIAPAFTNVALTPDNAAPGFVGVRTFTLSAAAINVLTAATTGGTPGTSYRFDIRFVATDSGNLLSIGSTIKNSVFTATGAVPPPNGITLSNPTVIVDQGNGSVTRPASTYNGTTLIDQKPTSATTPAFDINNGILTLKGGSITTTATGTSVVNGANLNYIVYAPNFTSTITTGVLQLSPGTTTSGVTTYSLTTGTADIILPIPTAGNGYILSISYQATYQNGGTGAPIPVTDNNGGPGYNATFNVAGTKTPAPTITANTITFDPNGVPPATTPPTPNPLSTFYINSPTTPQFQGANLSDPSNGGNGYDVNNGQLFLNGTTVTTTQAGASSISTVILYYRTRLSTDGGGAYQAITLTETGTANNGTRTFVIDPNGSSTISQPNLIATPAVKTAGAYSVDVYYQANGIKNGVPFTITDPPASGVYTANFTVTGTVTQTTIWTGSKNDNWFDPANWSAGVPTATNNALIRDLGTGVSVPYPNISSDAIVYVGTTTNVAYDNTGSGPAVVFSFTMGGSSQAQRSITRLIKGQLKVYGNFNNNYNSFIQREGTIMEFAGISTQDPTQVFSNPTTQTITGGTFVRVDISGGGKKEVTGIMNISESLNFLTPSVNAVNTVPTNTKTALAANAGILYTNVSVQPPLTLPTIVLADRATTNGNNGAQINGETDQSFLYGYAQTTRAGVGTNDPRTFGNLGVELNFTGVNAPGNVDITRNTVEAYSPVNARVGIRRIFGVRPGNPNTNTGGLQATMVFHYRTSETKNLGGATTSTPGTASIPEDKLIIFVSDNSGNTFSLIGRDGPVDQINKTVTRTGVHKFATFTLGDIDNPLPVRLTAFDAKRIGNDALVTWQTATEQNSKGYDVQVSTNGTEFRTLASVPSASPNTVKLTSYSYTDTEKNKAGTRYYRLHQVDLDGKDAFFAPVAVSFDGKATAATLVAYPNPFNGNDELHVAIQSATAGKGQLTITDMTGRTIRSTSVEVTSGLTDFTVNNMVDLKSGLYLVKFLLPSGEVKNLKIVKQ